ncbi:hypothetical protein [Pseudomonas rubra]|uniref:Ig-like domain-containing protein n=1 Tax=Pseudomonas rubra TaxID=2942627 RepID=A0ABT5PAT7_9PSED|nr:hypothetical protein [Pseudomonas rubra]MDD1015414.1 hypothetical protein [Pseudomonas rubra]MDD1039636.1 hypothetical protein [Pseudomonas rubra]MDD1153938.1 hypothetical protein [Pseudomonas rubra]
MTKQEVLPKTSKKTQASKPSTQQKATSIRSASRTATSHSRTLSTLPAPIVSPIEADGLILTANLARGLDVTIAEYEILGFDPEDIIDILVNGVAQFENIRVPFDHPPGSFPVVRTLTREQLGGDGVRRITYRVYNQNDSFSLAQDVIVDTLDPALNNPPPSPLLPEDLVGTEVTAEYLEANGDVLTLDVIRYADPKPGDRWALFMGVQSGPIKVGAVVPDEGGGRAYFSIDVPRVDLETLPGGYTPIWLKLTDRAGNESQFSYPQPMVLSLAPAPEDLEAPEVPEAPIDLADARQGVLVLVEKYTNWLSGDIVQVRWEGVVVGTFVTNEFHDWPLEATARFATVDKDEAYTAKVDYIVTRGRPFPSEIAEIEVDTTKAGPPNPEEPDPVNPNLLLPLLIGPVSELENELTPVDRGADVTVKLTVYSPVNPDEVIRLYYGPAGKLVATHTITTEAAGDVIDMIISADDIIEAGNGLAQLLFYRLYKNATGANYQESRPVEVRAVIEQLEGLALPSIVGVILPPTGNPTVLCEHAPWNGLTVLVSDPSKLELGDNVTVSWAMYAVGSSVPVEGTVVALRGDVSDPTHVEFGVPISVLWDDYIKPAPNLAFIRISWSVVRDGIPVGESAERTYQYNIRQGAGNCVPTFAQRHTAVRVGKL